MNLHSFRRICHGAAVYAALLCSVFFAGCEDDVVGVAVSPGGAYVAYATENAGLTLLDIASSASRTIELKNLKPGGLAWSPSGKRLVCVAQRAESRDSWDLILVDRENAQTTPLAPHPAREFDPAFAPDGRSLYFCSTRKGSADVYRYRFADGSVETVVEAPFDQVKPRPSPDGGKLAYVSYEKGSPEAVVREVGSKTPEPVVLKAPENGGALWDIQWAPGAADTIIVLYRCPDRSVALRYEAPEYKEANLLRLNEPIDSLIPLRDGMVAYSAAGRAYVRKNVLTGARRLIPDLPSEQSLLAADPSSGRYAAVIGKRFVATGSIDLPGNNVWFNGNDKALAWAQYLAHNEREVLAVDQLRSLLGRVSDPVKADEIRLLLASALRDSGDILGAWAEAETIFNRRSPDVSTRLGRAKAARALGEIALFDMRDKEAAAKWYGAASELQSSPTTAPVCNAQMLIGELSPGQLDQYADAVVQWRNGRYAGSARLFESLLKERPHSKPLRDEALSVFSTEGSTGWFFLRPNEKDPFESLIDDSGPLKYQARVAQAYVDARGEQSEHALMWLCAAQGALGDTKAARQTACRLLQGGMSGEAAGIASQLFAYYITDTGERFRKEWIPLEERRAKATLDRLMADSLLSAAVKDDLVHAWSQSTTPILQLMPELAEMRLALRRRDLESAEREGRFALGTLNSVAEVDKDDAWKLIAFLQAGMAAEIDMRRGNWLDTREACERALAYEPPAGKTEGEFVEEYREYLSGLMSLLFAGVEASSAFSRVMDIDSAAIEAYQRDPAGVSPEVWRQALRGYVSLLAAPQARQLRCVILVLMADAYAGLGYPGHQVAATLQAALSLDPPEPLKRTIQDRLVRLFETMGDPYLAKGLDKQR